MNLLETAMKRRASLGTSLGSGVRAGFAKRHSSITDTFGEQLMVASARNEVLKDWPPDRQDPTSECNPGKSLLRLNATCGWGGGLLGKGQSVGSAPKGPRRRTPRPLTQAGNRRSLNRRAAGPEQERWESFEEELSVEFARRGRLPGLSPYEKAHSYLKRHVYSYVHDCLERGDDRALEASIELALEGTSPKSPKFKENAFHWALHGLQKPGGIDIGKGAVLRYGRQLLYANQHHVPTHLLIGFLYQTGNSEEISRKVKLGEREDWFSEAQRQERT